MGGRTEWGKEMFLVIVGRADMVDQVVADVLRAEWTPSRLFYGAGIFFFESYSTEYIICCRLNDFLPDQSIKHSKQNSCEHPGINARSTIACKQIVQ